MRERAREFIGKARNGWCDHRSAIENCISINGFADQVPSNAPAHVPAQLPPRAARRPFQHPQKGPRFSHNFSRNRYSIDIGRARLIRDPRAIHSPWANDRYPQTVSAQRLRLARDYEKRIDVVHAMTRVAMGGNLIRRNTHPGFSKQTLSCVVSDNVGHATLLWQSDRGVLTKLPGLARRLQWQSQAPRMPIEQSRRTRGNTNRSGNNWG